MHPACVAALVVCGVLLAVPILSVVVFFSVCACTRTSPWGFDPRYVAMLLRIHLFGGKVDRGKLRDNLEAFADVLSRRGMKFWLETGTALGAIREGDIIEGDCDVDVGLRAEDRDRFHDEVLPDLVAAGFSVGKPEPLTLFRDQHYIDIEFLGRGLPCHAIQWPNLCDDHMDTIEPLQQARIGSRTYSAPSTAYLVRLYGEDWRVPKANFKPTDTRQPYR